MDKKVAAEWLEDMKNDFQVDGSPPPPPKEVEAIQERPRFICADHERIVDALKAIFILLAVRDRIKEPTRSETGRT